MAACANTERPTNLDLRAVMDLEPYWEAVRKVYAPFESGCPARPAASTTTRFPAGSSPTFGSRRSPLGWGEVRADRGDVYRGERHFGQTAQGDPVIEGGG